MALPSSRTFPPHADYASLSMRDLLDARDAYHVYLSTLENVVATAVGRYLIHEDDWYAKHAPNEPRPKDVARVREARTMGNSVVRPWSWPAVLVFVRRWDSDAALGNQVVPRTLYLPDGRAIPTCVIVAEPDEASPPPVPGPSQASHLYGGGYACMRDQQHAQRVGTIGCLVSRAGSYYALTNRHVTGEDRDVISAYVRGAFRPIGVSAGVARSHITMPEAFPAWPGVRTRVTLDAGLIRINNIHEWTSQAFGIGEVGEPFDATECTVTLDLIGCPMRAFGGVSGVIEGEIRALFFRYESLGGLDRTTDLLIGPATEMKDRVSGNALSRDTRLPPPPFTRPGDSGTLWFYDPPRGGTNDPHGDIGGQEPPERGQKARRLRPVAMQWGGERFRNKGESSAFALATFISTICRELEVDIVRDWSTGHDEYWGKLGHFAVGWKTCDRVAGGVGELMKLNQARIGFGDEDLGKGSAFKMGSGAFVPLADVPDYVWVRRRSFEPIQHFADIDIVDVNGGPSLLDRSATDPSSVSPKVWKEYFDGFKEAGVGPEEGVLPFRVWQLWEDMVRFAKEGDALRFVAAGGVMAHYVGDASQPLHCSYLHHGKPPMAKHQGRKYPVPRDSEEFKAFKETREAQIHGIYEETMLEIDTASVLDGVDAALAQMPSNAGTIQDGHSAALAVMGLMRAAQERLSPTAIIEADDPALGPKTRARALWENKDIAGPTMISLADSVRVLADLWTSAWDAGGDGIESGNIREFSEQEVAEVYNDKSFAVSYSLDRMAELERFN